MQQLIDESLVDLSAVVVNVANIFRRLRDQVPVTIFSNKFSFNFR